MIDEILEDVVEDMVEDVVEEYNYEYGGVITQLPIIALRGALVFPGSTVHLDVGRKKSLDAIDLAMNRDKEVFMIMQQEAYIEDPGVEDLVPTGCVSTIKQVMKMPSGTVRLVVEGHFRGVIETMTEEAGTLEGEIRVFEDETYSCSDLEIEAAAKYLKDQYKEFSAFDKKMTPDIVAGILATDKIAKLPDIVAHSLSFDVEKRQIILDALDLEERFMAVNTMLKRELEIEAIEQSIDKRVRQQMEKNQKEYYLREQIKAIHEELGEDDNRESEVQLLRERVATLDLPDEVFEKVEKEIKRLQAMPSQMAEANVIHNYIEWLLDLPWNKCTADNDNLNVAEEILNADHYGLEKVKERILEHLAVRQLVDNPKGSIICLVGPPGVGKTSLARSIAKALGKEYVRLSFGGVRDESEIRGHRRTYIGAMPGRIIQSMKTAGSANPLFLLDEIDKLANDFRGDPASALLEVLDPEQNNAFSDHYIEMPYDLSKVLFVTTANVESAIPGPLADRMEVIRLSGYTDEEKLQIAIRHLVPKQLKETGLDDGSVTITENALKAVIANYTREAGVRNLERNIAKICRVIAREVVCGKAVIVKVTAQNIGKYLGVPRFKNEEGEKNDEVAVATGLAWTSVGGVVLKIEAAKLEGKGGLQLTGKLGDVMQESAKIAYSYVRSCGEDYGAINDVTSKVDVHLHVPEGATPKDGPSAGVTMVTVLASLFSNRKIDHKVAMTGEVTLRGRVMAIGGLKEKSLAAYAAGCTTVIMPKDNIKDLEEIPANIRKKIKFIPVSHVEEVLDIALLPAEETQGLEVENAN